MYDKDAKSGSIEVTVDMSSINFGMPKLNEHAKSAEMFDVAKFPTATYTGKFAKFNGASPTEAEGHADHARRDQTGHLEDQFLQVRAKSR